MSSGWSIAENTSILAERACDETPTPSSVPVDEQAVQSPAAIKPRSCKLKTCNLKNRVTAARGNRFERALEVGVVAFCLTQSIGLVEAWVHSPFDFLGWVAFLIWLSPLLYQRWTLQESKSADVANGTEATNVAYRIAILLCLAAIMTDLRLLGYFGLAAALVGWSYRHDAHEINRRRVTLVLLTTSLAWMPLLGWITSPLLGSYTFVARLLLATTGAATTCFFERRTLHLKP